ncbi:MAG: tetratricopeptide repeat protein [Rhodospirillaceae bacterium]
MDDRLALAIKYYQSNLDAQASLLVAEVMAEPDPPAEAISISATLAFERRDLQSALTYCDLLLTKTPDDGHALLLKGRVLSDLGDQQGALQMLAQAVDVEPGLAAAHYNLGWVRERVGDISGAITAYQSAVTLQDPYPVAWNNLGLAFERAGEAAAAADAFQNAIDQFPAFSMAHNNLGALRAAGGEFHAAAQAYGTALSANPDNIDAATNQGVALLEQGDITAAVTVFESVLDKVPDHLPAVDNILYAEMYRADDPADIRRRHDTVGDRVLPYAQAPKALARKIELPIRVGFISPDFRRHSVSRFALPLIQAINSAKISVILCSDVREPDDITQTYKSVAAEWIELSDKPDDDVIACLREAKLDVAVDLAGHTTGNRLRALASRIAPVQITGLGYPGPSGVPAIDYWLCDEITNPLTQGDDFHRDRPLYLRAGLHVFAPPTDSPPVSPLPSLDNGYVTFGSFNKAAKISDQTVALWAQVLRELPDARLLLKARAFTEDETANALKARFGTVGVAEDRIQTMGWATQDTDHLALYQGVDIALDTFPYNGTTTTCEALWMGVPVVTLRGNSHAARVGASLLTSAGLSDHIAGTPDAFIHKAVALAKNTHALKDLRESLRDQLSESRLTDAAGAARSFEDAIERALK